MMGESSPEKHLGDFRKKLDSLSETLNYFKPNERDKAIQILQECIDDYRNNFTSVSDESHEINNTVNINGGENISRSYSIDPVENFVLEKSNSQDIYMKFEEQTSSGLMTNYDSSTKQKSNFKQKSAGRETENEVPEENIPSEDSDYQSEEDWNSSLMCPKCKEEFGNKSDLLEHLQSHMGKPKSCVDCHKIFHNSTAFRCHKQLAMCVKSGKVFKCELCNRTLYGESQYNTHQSAHKRNQCKLCGDHFSRQKHLEAHIINIHNSSLTKDMFGCHLCDRQFVQRRSLVYHYKLIHPGNDVLCSVCLEMFPSKAELEAHLASHKLTSFECQKCGQRFSRRQQYLVHLKEHERYKCETCGEGFSNKKAAEAHATQGHSVRGLEPQLQCAQCGQLFLTRSQLNAHMMDHTGGKRLSCEKCKMTFKREYNYRNHLQTNEHLRGEAPKNLLACEECGKTFTNKNNLRVHVTRVHKANQEYACSYCSYKTRVKNNLKRHITSHTDKPQFICDKCGGQFNSKASLQEHLSRLHSDSKNFSCDKCGNVFSRSSDLNRHLMNKHSDMPLYSCHCGNSYKSLNSLRRHQLLGHGNVEDKQKQLKKLCPSEGQTPPKKKSKKAKDKPESTTTSNSSDADNLHLINSQMPDVSSVITEPSTIVVMADRHPQDLMQVSYGMEFTGEDKSQVVYTQSLDMSGLQVVDSMIHLENNSSKQEPNVLINVRNIFGRNDYILPPPVVNSLDSPMASEAPSIAMPSQKQDVMSGLQEYMIPNDLNFL